MAHQDKSQRVLRLQFVAKEDLSKMKPHVFVPRVILRNFSITDDGDGSVLVLDKSTRSIRARGINHRTFLGSSNYLGSGAPGTLENEMATKDESSINALIRIIREGQDLQPYFSDLKFLLGNHSARNPAFRKHPKVLEHSEHSTEEFHTIAMDVFPESYLRLPICVFHISLPQHSFILPDFSLKVMVLSPDIAIARIHEGNQPGRLDFSEKKDEKVLERVNQRLFDEARSWVVANSRATLQIFSKLSHHF